HELLWYVTHARALPAAESVHAELDQAAAETDRLARLPAATLRDLDVEPHRQAVNSLLRRASDLARSAAPRPRPDHQGSDLVGAVLPGAALRGANLRGAVLVGANLGRADL